MEPSVIEEVRLTAFKSFRGAVLPLDELTLMVGRNGSGKSNALDGLWVLSRLALGEDIRDALDGGREGPAIRGGTAGCAPFGESCFSLGVSVRTGADVVHLDVTIQTEPAVQLIYESLRGGDRDLIVTDPPRSDSGDITAEWDFADTSQSFDSARSVRPLRFRASRLLVNQVLSRVPATPTGQQVHLAAAQVLAALRSVFVLDPVPDQMRQYVPRRDILLRRNADNLSAAAASLLGDPETRQSLLSAMSQLNGQQVIDLTTSASELDDLMLTLVERFRGEAHQVPARVMSDGSLRFLAILVALAQAPTVEASPPTESSEAVGQTTVVIEELENGLHASQAKMLVGLIRADVKRRRVRVLATAHSPAVLDAVTGDEHHSVIVCQRDSNGQSTLDRLTDLPNYVGIAAKGGLGAAAEGDHIRTRVGKRDPKAVLEEILGRSLR